MNSTTIDRPLSDAMELILRRADELQRRKTAETPIAAATATAKPETLTAVFKRWRPQPCCSQCGAEGPVSKKLKLCDECKHKRELKQAFKYRRFNHPGFVARIADYRAGEVDFVPLDGQAAIEGFERYGIANCPLCGCEIDADSIGCWKHATILLMRKLKATERFSG